MFAIVALGAYQPLFKRGRGGAFGQTVGALEFSDFAFWGFELWFSGCGV